jgi:hypothetical protein
MKIPTQASEMRHAWNKRQENTGTSFSNGEKKKKTALSHKYITQQQYQGIRLSVKQNNADIYLCYNNITAVTKQWYRDSY